MAACACSKQAPVSGDDFEMDAATLVKYRGKAENVTIPSGVISIGDYAFDNCNSLTNVTIPSSVVSVGDYAFNYYELETVVISKRTRIGTRTFRNAQITYID